MPHERRWIILAADGRHSTLGRITPPDEEEVARAASALAAVGLAGQARRLQTSTNMHPMQWSLTSNRGNKPECRWFLSRPNTDVTGHLLAGMRKSSSKISELRAPYPWPGLRPPHRVFAGNR